MNPQERSERARRNFRKVGLFVIILLVINFAYQAWIRYSNRAAVPAREPCDLSVKSCTVRMPEGKTVTFDIEPKTIPTGKPVTFTVTTGNIDVQQVKAFVASLDDVRNLTEIELVSQDKNTHKVTTVLQRANSSEEGWLVIVHIFTPAENIAVPYKFSSDGQSLGSSESVQ